MKEFIVLLGVANGCFILGAIFGGAVYHAIQSLAQKGKTEVKEYALKAKDGIEHAL